MPPACGDLYGLRARRRVPKELAQPCRDQELLAVRHAARRDSCADHGDARVAVVEPSAELLRSQRKTDSSQLSITSSYSLGVSVARAFRPGIPASSPAM